LNQNTKYIAYYRVSTDRQGQSGLGLEAQQQSVQQHLGCHKAQLINEFTEIESGGKNNRTELNKALELCKKEKATLIIAKLDRLTRNVHFISGLMESKVDFIAADNPHANKLMIHMLAAFAEHEREMISQRTKAALKAAKARGVRLGVNGEKLAAANKKEADEFAHKMRSILGGLQREGLKTIREITTALNERKILSATGQNWHVSSTYNIMKRIEKLSIKHR